MLGLKPGDLVRFKEDASSGMSTSIAERTWILAGNAGDGPAIEHPEDSLAIIVDVSINWFDDRAEFEEAGWDGPRDRFLGNGGIHIILKGGVMCWIFGKWVEKV